MSQDTCLICVQQETTRLISLCIDLALDLHTREDVRNLFTALENTTEYFDRQIEILSSKTDDRFSEMTVDIPRSIDHAVTKKIEESKDNRPEPRLAQIAFNFGVITYIVLNLFDVF